MLRPTHAVCQLQHRLMQVRASCRQVSATLKAQASTGKPCKVYVQLMILLSQGLSLLVRRQLFLLQLQVSLVCSRQLLASMLKRDPVLSTESL